MIRPAQEKDIPGILRLLVQVDMVHHRGRPDLFKGPATKYSESELRALLNDPEKPVFVYADAEGNVLAHCFCVFRQEKNSGVMTDVKTLYIDDLCVDEACRGRHIGREMYAFVQAFARSEHCYNITLNVWALNPAALRFYEACGLKTQKIGMEEIL